MGEGKNLVGVDIGTSSIKVVQIKESRRGLGLQRLGYVPLNPQTIVDGQVMDASAVVEGLMRVFHDAKIKQKEIAISVSGQSVIIRKITVPMMTREELNEQIHWEAEQHIPFDIKDVQVDYQVLRKKPETSQMELLLVAAKRDQINDYAQLARDARLKPVVCDIDAFTVQNMFEYSRGLPPDQTIGLINVGASLCSLNIIANNLVPGDAYYLMIDGWAGDLIGVGTGFVAGQRRGWRLTANVLHGRYWRDLDLITAWLIAIWQPPQESPKKSRHVALLRSAYIPSDAYMD